MTYWSSKGKVALQSPLYGDKFDFLYATRCSFLYFFPEFITLTHLLWAFFPCRGLFLSEAGSISLGLLQMCSWWACEHLERCLSVPAAPHFQAQHTLWLFEVNVSSCRKVNRVIMLSSKKGGRKAVGIISTLIPWHIPGRYLKGHKRGQQPHLQIDDLVELLWRPWIYSSENMDPSSRP